MPTTKLAISGKGAKEMLGPTQKPDLKQMLSQGVTLCLRTRRRKATNLSKRRDTPEEIFWSKAER
jgi:hypothetical protein